MALLALLALMIGSLAGLVIGRWAVVLPAAAAACATAVVVSPAAGGVAALGAATEAFGWMGRYSDHPVARALRRPGFELQRVAATRDPTPAELEVAEAALAEVLRLEGAPA